jgi:hypothetical protein
VASLKACRHSQLGTRQSDGAKNKALSGCSLETGFRFLDRRIFFERGLENALKSNGVGCVRETNYDEQGKVNNRPL